MYDRVIFYRSGLRRKWRWRYVSWNGNIMADSGQGYADKRDAVNGVSRVTGSTLSPDNEWLRSENRAIMVLWIEDRP